MSEEDPLLGPEQEQHLRALLADLGSTGAGAEPMPDHVAARLDDVLAGLSAERGPARRPSRWRPRLAAAAAAVVVLGLGGLAAVHLGRTDPSRSTASGSTRSTATPSLPAESTDRSSAGSSATPPSAAGDAAGDSAGGRRLSSATFARDVTALLGGDSSLRTSAAGGSTSARTPAPTRLVGCPGPDVTDGAAVTRAVLDSSPVALVVHPPQAGRRLVEAWSCDGAHRLASTTVAP